MPFVLCILGMYWIVVFDSLRSPEPTTPSILRRISARPQPMVMWDRRWGHTARLAAAPYPRRVFDRIMQKT